MCQNWAKIGDKYAKTIHNKCAIPQVSYNCRTSVLIEKIQWSSSRIIFLLFFSDASYFYTILFSLYIILYTYKPWNGVMANRGSKKLRQQSLCFYSSPIFTVGFSYTSTFNVNACGYSSKPRNPPVGIYGSRDCKPIPKTY